MLASERRRQQALLREKKRKKPQAFDVKIMAGLCPNPKCPSNRRARSIGEGDEGSGPRANSENSRSAGTHRRSRRCLKP